MSDKHVLTPDLTCFHTEQIPVTFNRVRAHSVRTE
jgi:hypothetical protein